MQVEGVGLGPGAGADGEGEVAFPGAREHSLPFAVTAVESQHGIAGFQPQHVAEVVCLRGVERDGRPLVERGVEIETRGAEIVARHGH
jgi:hypothetical protein